MAFLNPLFLLGGLAVAVPILLHLIKRKNARKIEFPTLMFLRRIDKKTIRYQKLRHLLLLLLRILAFLFIVFSFMRPYLNKTAPLSAAVLGRTASAHIIALDNSMSMSYQDRWERAKTAAAEIVRQSNPGDTFAILEFSDRIVIRTQLTSDESAVLNGIEDASEPGDQPTRYAQALRAAEKIARQAGTEKRIIHLISDFQKSGWTDEERAFQLSAGIELQYVDLGSDTFSNLATRNVRTIISDQGSSSNLSIKASIVELGGQDRDTVQVGLIVDGSPTSEKTIHVTKESTAEIEFQVSDLKAGEHSIVLETDDPYLERDNRFYMTVEVREKTPVTVVEKPERITTGRRPASFFLTKALNVDRLSPYDDKVVSPEDLDISGRLLIWNNLPIGSSAIQKQLEDFVREGGGIIVVLGNSTETAEFNRSFGNWIPVKMEESPSLKKQSRARPTDDYVLMTDIQTSHPIFQPFGKPYSGTFSNARFYNYVRIKAGAGAEILARFDNGDPALISFSLDRGRILIFTSSADDAGNDLPLKPVYAPFWQQMLRHLEGIGEQRNWLEIGDVIDPEKFLSENALRRGDDAPDTGEAIAILDPSKQRLEPSPDAAGIVTEKVGFYDIRTMDLNATVAVNTIPAESDLTHHSAEEMTSAWMASQPEVFHEDEAFADEEKDKNQHIWIFLFGAALLFLIAELILSNSGLHVDNDRGQKTTAVNS